MKYKKFIIIIFALLVILFVYLFSNKYVKVASDSDKKVLIEHSFLSSKGNFNYKGIVLFDDGTIYSWNSTDEVAYSKLTNMYEKSLWIIKNGSKSKKRIGKNTLKKIKEYIDNLNDDNTKTEYKGTNEGITSIKVWDYKDAKYFILEESGDYETLNESKESKKIIKFTNKNLKIKE